MSDYIEREAAVNAIMGEPTDAHYPGWYAGKIAALPAAPVREVVQGRWDIKAYGCYCSVCGTGSNMPYWNFCPNCGADMRGPVANIDVGRKEKGGPT